MKKLGATKLTSFDELGKVFPLPTELQNKNIKVASLFQAKMIKDEFNFEKQYNEIFPGYQSNGYEEYEPVKEKQEIKLELLRFLFNAENPSEATLSIIVDKENYIPVGGQGKNHYVLDLSSLVTIIAGTEEVQELAHTQVFAELFPERFKRFEDKIKKITGSKKVNGKYSDGLFLNEFIDQENAIKKEMPHCANKIATGHVKKFANELYLFFDQTKKDPTKIIREIPSQLNDKIYERETKSETQKELYDCSYDGFDTYRLDEAEICTEFANEQKRNIAVFGQIENALKNTSDTKLLSVLLNKEAFPQITD